MLDSSDFIKVEEETFCISEETFEDLLRDFKGRKCVFITNAHEYRKRISEELTKRKIDRTMGPVYYFKDKHPLSETEFEDDPRKALRYKRDYFSYQREYRLIINEMVEDSFTLNIGDINNISFIVNIEDLKEIVFGFKEIKLN
ncbi:hypothetical protein ACFRH9_26000 [Peribacillus butanolivorans]|uniref:hypothetical protein n=1 Tax=Peribacillus butanolivorans TaxID=421767 RepID=UPI00366E3405